MKNLLLVILLSCCSYLAGMAQPGKLTEEKRKEFEAQKVAFFTQELELSPEEAAVFWPLYNEMQRKYRAVEQLMREEYQKVGETKAMKESDYVTAINTILAHEQKMRDIKKEYYGRLVKVIPASKIWRLEGAERRFHRQLFDKLRRECGMKK